MSVTGEQLHPNWRALATVHIPLKRFVKEGTKEVQRRTNISHEKYKIVGHEVREFYEELVATGDNRKNDDNNLVINRKQNKLCNKSNNNQEHKPKVPFEVRNYFRYAMENKVDELKRMDFEGQNFNVCDSYGWSALMMASCEGAYQTADFLLKLGVDRCIKDKSGRKAKDLAYKKGHLNIVHLLEKNHRESEVIQVEKNKIKEPFYCEICKQSFKETSKSQHYTSTVHQFNIKSNISPNKLQKFNISSRNKGLQLMVKQGWDKESGLGPSQLGRLYPVKTVIRKQHSGLGIEQEAARVTHFDPYDQKAVQRQISNNWKKKSRSRNDIRREKLREWKRDRRLRNELN